MATRTKTRTKAATKIKPVVAKPTEIKLSEKPIMLPRSSEKICVSYKEFFAISAILPARAYPFRHMSDVGNGARMIDCPELAFWWVPPNQDDGAIHRLQMSFDVSGDSDFSNDYTFEYDGSQLLCVWPIISRTKNKVVGTPFLLGNTDSSGAICESGSHRGSYRDMAVAINSFFISPFNDHEFQRVVLDAALDLNLFGYADKSKYTKIVEMFSSIPVVGSFRNLCKLLIKKIRSFEADLGAVVHSFCDLISGGEGVEEGPVLENIAECVAVCSEISSYCRVIIDLVEVLENLEDYLPDHTKDFVRMISEALAIDNDIYEMGKSAGYFEACRNTGKGAMCFSEIKKSKSCENYKKKHPGFAAKLTQALSTKPGFEYGYVIQDAKDAGSVVGHLQSLVEECCKLLTNLQSSGDDSDRYYLTPEQFYSLINKHDQLAKWLKSEVDLNPLFKGFALESDRSPDILLRDPSLCDLSEHSGFSADIESGYTVKYGLAFGWYLQDVEKYIVEVGDNYYLLDQKRNVLSQLQTDPDGTIHVPCKKG